MARVEAIDAVYELVPAPRARNARRLLGHVLRDAGLLQDALDELDGRPGFPRGALVVGLGILGEVASFESTVPNDSDHDAAAAWALAVALVDWEGAGEVMEQPQREASWPARGVVETALRRTRSGFLVSTVG